MNVKYAPVAQLDRVSDSDSEGRAFESHQAYQRQIAAFKTHFANAGCVFSFYIQKSLSPCLRQDYNWWTVVSGYRQSVL